jgi:tetratricopeptide (TPR) repeat protein
VPHVRLFLSTVSAEFKGYRERLRHLLDRPNVTVKVQEDFIVTGDETLEMLDTYIRECDGVIHLVGDMTGAMAKPPSVVAMREQYPDLAERLPLAEFLQPDGPSLSYTQWEAWLALLHGKPLFIATPTPEAPRDPDYRLDPGQQGLQKAHLARLKEVARYAGVTFSGKEELAAEVLRSFVLDLLVKAGLSRRPSTLPFASIGSLFKGRSALMERIEAELGRPGEQANAAAIAVALVGNGGVGKSRLAIEYAWLHAGQHPALLYVSAGSAEALSRNLAGLCALQGLDLPEKSLTDQEAQRQAVISWLGCHPGWLVILDNVDNEPAAEAVESLLPQLSGGKVLITTRLRNWSSAVNVLPVDVLEPEDAVAFLLERTAGRRRAAVDDAATAKDLAADLGHLALALEQAGAYIGQRRLTLAGYRAEWERRRGDVMAWFDPRLMQYPSSVAITWLTSFEQLGEAARKLLRRLAWLSPEPIPESLLEVALPGVEAIAAAEAGAAMDALVELEDFSLVNRSVEAPEFTVHRLVQEVGRQGQRQDPAISQLEPALRWLDAAFEGDPEDVSYWPVLDPLAAHVQAVTGFADGAGLADPTARLMNQLGLLLLTKAAYGEAEPLLRRALAIDEAAYGSNHPLVAIRLNNLAQLLQDTNRLAEAEPLMRRVVENLVAGLGPNHPDVGTALNNLAQLLKAKNRLAEAEPLLRRALAIDEATCGTHHPAVAIDLNNLAELLQATNRLTEAEPLMRRALAIDEGAYGPEHPYFAIRINNLATLLQATNRLAEAETLYRLALAIDETAFGPQHPNVARDLNNLAALLKTTNRLAEAEPLMRRALAIAEASYGPEHYKVATGLNNLAALLQATNRLEEAEPLIRRALEIDEAAYGPEHPDVAKDLNNLGMLLQATNLLAEAEPLMRRGLVILLSFGFEHPNLQAGLANYIKLLKAMDLTEAEISERLKALQPSA